MLTEKKRQFYLWLRSDAAIYLFLALLPFLFFWRETLGWLTLTAADGTFWFFPAWRLAAEQVQRGQLPLWNPNLYSGFPLFAEWQAGLLDPLNWLHVFGATSRTLTLAQELSFSIALLGTFSFTRRLGICRRASVVAAVIYAFNGYLVARTIYPGLLHVTALMPFTLWSIEKLFQLGRWREVGIGAFFIAWQIFAGHPQPLAYSAVVTLCYAGFCLTFRRSSERESQGQAVSDTASANPSGRRNRMLRIGLQVTLMYVLGIGIALVQLLPAAELASQSVRQQVPYEFFTWHSLHPISLLVTLFPYLHGQGSGIYQMAYWGPYWHHNEAQIYLGFISFTLAVTGCFALWRSRSREIAFWSVLGIIGVLLSLGKYVPPVAKLLYHIPIWGSFRSPNRHWMEVTIAVSVLAGFAVDYWLKVEAQAFKRTLRLVSIVLAVLCVGSGISMLFWRGTLDNYIRGLGDLSHLPGGFLQKAGAEFYAPVIVALVSATVILLCSLMAKPGKWYPLLLVVLLLDLQLYAVFAPINSEPRLERLLGLTITPKLEQKNQSEGGGRYHVLLKASDASFNPFWFYGHEMATGYDPLLNIEYKKFSGINEAGNTERLSVLETKDRTLDLLNVRYVLALPNAEEKTASSIRPVAKYGGIEFASASETPVMDLKRGQIALFPISASDDEELGILSNLANAAEIKDGEKVAEISISCQNQQRLVADILAGQDTAEWAWERADVRSAAKHHLAMVAESWPGDSDSSFSAHSYLAKVKLPPNALKCTGKPLVQIKSQVREGVTLILRALSLYDRDTGKSHFLAQLPPNLFEDESRWRKLDIAASDKGYRNLQVFENLRVLPRYWLVHHAQVKTEEDQLKAIRAENMEEEFFDPQKSVLIRPESAADLDQLVNASPPDPASSSNQERVSIISKTPTETVIDIQAQGNALLAISNVFARGWRGQLDGVEIRLHKINYLFQGIAVPAGQHRIRLFYWPRSLTFGASASLIALLVSLYLLFYSRSR
ncbi:MAG: YfhO family protein [Acidobacteriota bacterium]